MEDGGLGAVTLECVALQRWTNLVICRNVPVWCESYSLIWEASAKLHTFLILFVERQVRLYAMLFCARISTVEGGFKVQGES